MLRLLVASIAGLVAFFPLFWLFAWVTRSNDTGALIALPLGFIGVPALILKLWPRSDAARSRNKIIGALAVIWGGAIVAFGFMNRSGQGGSSAYEHGYATGLVFGGLLVAVGLFFLIKGDTKREP
jgi:O-antigen/teichoic acid export membrane protein